MYVSLEVSNSTFTDGKGSHIHATLAPLHVSDSEFSDSIDLESDGHGILCDECRQVLIENTKFSGLTGYRGAAFKLARPPSGSEVTIRGSTFEGNLAVFAGGAIFLDRP